MTEKLIELLQEKPLVLPTLFLKVYRDLNLTEKELLLLIYLWNHMKEPFNPKEVEETLGFSKSEVLELTSSLSSKDCLEIKVEKIGNHTEEYISLEEFYQKLALHLRNEPKKEVKTNLFDQFEEEFGRPLSSMEYEIIGGWLSGEFTEEVVLEALKEAVYNGVFNLRYIDKILYEWKKKGIRSKEDIERDKKSFMEKKQETKELFDYDWLNDDTE